MMDVLGMILCLLIQGVFGHSFKKTPKIITEDQRSRIPLYKLRVATSTKRDAFEIASDLAQTPTPDSKDSECIFPFIYHGVPYSECITLGNRTRKWCATTANYDMTPRWRYCCREGECPDESASQKRAVQVDGIKKKTSILHKLKADLSELYRDINAWEKDMRHENASAEVGTSTHGNRSSEDNQFQHSKRVHQTISQLQETAEKLISEEDIGEDRESATNSPVKANSKVDLHHLDMPPSLVEEDDQPPERQAHGHTNYASNWLSLPANADSESDSLHEHLTSADDELHQIATLFSNASKTLAIETAWNDTSARHIDNETKHPTYINPISKEDLTSLKNSNQTLKNDFGDIIAADRTQGSAGHGESYNLEDDDEQDKNTDVFSVNMNAASEDSLASPKYGKKHTYEGVQGSDLTQNTSASVENERAIHKPTFSRRAGLVKTVGGNANGASCAFPFVYDERTYETCTTEPRDREWCSTTHSYDKSPTWGYCCQDDDCQRLQRDLLRMQQTELTKLHTQDQQEDVVEKKRVTLDEVLSQTEKSSFVNEQHSEREESDQSIRTVGGNANGKSCVFPFVADGSSHFTCIPNNEGRSWCAVTKNFDKTPLYGFCCDDRGTYGNLCSEQTSVDSHRRQIG